MSIYDTIKHHRSIRKYKPDSIHPGVLDRILKAGIRASSSGNMQAYSIIVTKDPEIKNRLHAPHFKQSMVLEAPVLMTFCADFHRMRLWLEQRHAPDNFNNFMSFMIAAIDTILVSQNVALAAETGGLGICYMGTTLASCDEIAEILKLPKNVVPVVGFSLGYPSEHPPQRDRLPLSGIVHEDTYRDYTPEQIDAIYKEKEVSGWNRYMEKPDPREMAIRAEVQNLAQVYTRLKYTKESHIGYSRTVLNFLRDQDFLNDC